MSGVNLLLELGNERFLYLLQLFFWIVAVYGYRGERCRHCLHQFWCILVEGLGVGVFKCFGHARQPRGFSNQFWITIQGLPGSDLPIYLLVNQAASR
jgi:hypothetical protein